MGNCAKQPGAAPASLTSIIRSRPFAYGFAVVITALTLWARAHFSAWIGDRPVLVIFFIPIIMSAYIGGLGPGLVATAIAALGANYYLIPPTHSFGFRRPIDLVQWLFLIAGGILASALNEALHRARQRADTNQRLYAVTLASIGEAVITTDELGRVTFLNGEAERLTGWKNAEAAGQLLPVVFHLINKDTQKPVEDLVEKVFRLGAAVGLANPAVLIARGGQEFIIDDSGAPIRQADGKIIGVVLVFRDNSKQKAAEQALRESESRLLTVFHSSPVGIVISRISDGKILEANEAFAAIHGYALPEIIGRKSNELELWAEPKQREQLLDILNTQGRCKDFETKSQKKDRSKGDLLLSVEVIHLAGEKCMLGLMRDVTERKAAEQQLLQLAVIVESSEDAIISKTLDGVITSWNRGAETIFGYSASETIGQSMLMLFPNERKKEEAEILAKIVKGHSVEHFDTERIRKDGTRIRISATSSPLKNRQGEIVGASTIARDTTHQHTLEEQLRQSQKMEAIGQLAGGVAHDFNNILAVIQMQTELWKMGGNFSSDQVACIDEIQTAANRAANLTRQLLLFSRRQRLQPRELDLSDSITGMTKMLRRILGEDIQMQFKYAPQPLFIFADAGMMDQVLMNLTVNSRDAMPNGGQLVIETAAVEFDELAASQSAQAHPGFFVRLSVSDTGTGIPPKILSRIFEPFFTTKDVGKGTGLGLATVFSIVQQHQGWISVYSEPGQGTTFHIYLPRLTKTSARQAAVTSALAVASGGDETILLVEDDLALRASVLKALLQLGYEVLEASNGTEALQVWKQHQNEIDLVLTDLVMPGGISGKELGQAMLSENPKLKVIYMSGYSAEIAGKDFLLEKGVNFLSKPFPVQMLAQTARACLDKN